MEQDVQVLQDLELVSFKFYGREKVLEAWGYAKRNRAIADFNDNQKRCFFKNYILEFS